MVCQELLISGGNLRHSTVLLPLFKKNLDLKSPNTGKKTENT